MEKKRIVFDRTELIRQLRYLELQIEEFKSKIVTDREYYEHLLRAEDRSNIYEFSLENTIFSNKELDKISTKTLKNIATKLEEDLNKEKNLNLMVNSFITRITQHEDKLKSLVNQKNEMMRRWKMMINQLLSPSLDLKHNSNGVLDTCDSEELYNTPLRNELNKFRGRKIFSRNLSGPSIERNGVIEGDVLFDGKRENNGWIRESPANDLPSFANTKISRRFESIQLKDDQLERSFSKIDSPFRTSDVFNRNIQRKMTADHFHTNFVDNGKKKF